jgi:tetratricopeptide (TPR) repeat protein
MTDPARPDQPAPTPSHVTGDVFTGGKRETHTEGGDYYENVHLPPAPTVDARFSLPRPPDDFTGREAELNELRAGAANGASGIFGLRGQGGIGKTALALVLAHELAPQYPAAQIYLDLLATTTPLTPGAALGKLIHAFDLNARLPDDLDQLQSLYRSLLHGQRALLFLDNALDAAQVTPLVPPAGCLLLLTSRQRFALPGLRPLNLDTLPRADSVALLRAIAPRIETHADTIAQLCGDLPLALRLAGSALAEREDLTPDGYVTKLRTEQGRMTALGPVMASLALSYDLLTPDLQAAWRALAVVVGDFDQAAATAVIGRAAKLGAFRALLTWLRKRGAVTSETTEPNRAMSDLLRYSMVEYDPETQRYRLHDLARDAARQRLEGDERDRAERRHAAHYAQALSAADDLYLKGGERVLAGLRLFDQERANIEAGQSWAAARAETDDEAARLCDDYPNAGVYVLELRQHPRDQIGWMEAALAAARKLENRANEGVHLGNLGNAYADLGAPRRAIEFYEQYLSIAREIGDRRGEGQALGNLGNAYYALGETRQAIE